MWMRLALAMGRPVRALQREMTSAEFAEWCAYYQLEPFGPPADWARHGAQMALWANAHRKPGTRPYRPDEFLPRAPQTPEEQIAIFRALAQHKHDG